MRLLCEVDLFPLRGIELPLFPFPGRAPPEKEAPFFPFSSPLSREERLSETFPLQISPLLGGEKVFLFFFGSLTGTPFWQKKPPCSLPPPFSPPFTPQARVEKLSSPFYARRKTPFFPSCLLLGPLTGPFLRETSRPPPLPSLARRWTSPFMGPPPPPTRTKNSLFSTINFSGG